MGPLATTSLTKEYAMTLSDSVSVVGAIVLGVALAYGAIVGVIWLDVRDAHRKLQRIRDERAGQ
jgi:hypothetical protein